MEVGWLSERLAKQQDLLILPGAYDALSARLIALEGAEAVYCGGFAATASRYALPDLGLLGLSDLTAYYRSLAAACQGKALIVDADTGHGGLLNVERTVEALAAAGAAAFHIEDQVSPKRCGHLAGKSIDDRATAFSRVRTAVVAAERHGMDVIARTDAIAVSGLEEAVERGNRFLDLGAVAIFVDAPASRDQIEAIPRRIGGPVLFNAAPTGTGPVPDHHDLTEMGYRIVIHPIEAMLAAASAARKSVRSLLGSASEPNALDFEEVNEVLETRTFLQREERYAQQD